MGFSPVPHVRSSRWMDGTVSNFNMSLGIFNPELSVSGLAFWAGFGFGAWFYNFDENDVFGEGTGVNASFDDMNISGNVFVELDYKIADIFHMSSRTLRCCVLAGFLVLSTWMVAGAALGSSPEAGAKGRYRGECRRLTKQIDHYEGTILPMAAQRGNRGWETRHQ